MLKEKQDGKENEVKDLKPLCEGVNSPEAECEGENFVTKEDVMLDKTVYLEVDLVLSSEEEDEF